MNGRPGAADQHRVRVVRIISRLNVGGPAIQAVTLTRLLEPLGYSTLLVRGREDRHEGNLDHLARRLGVHPTMVRSLRRNPGPHDVHALGVLVGLLRRTRPSIVHTHAAKAGALGRLAALLACPDARLVHTYHGHSLRGYFSPSRNRVLVGIERWLARRTHRLVAVSEEVRDDLVGLGVAPPERFEVVRVGFDLAPFLVDEPERGRRRAALRAQLGIPEEAHVVTLVARLVPIKRVDRFLRVANLLADEQDLVFLVVGDGQLRSELRSGPEARSLGERLIWAGLRHDMPDVYFGSDVVVQTSDSEGTPVSLIEAQAAGLPVVTTMVGGVRSVVREGETGWLAPAGDERALAEAIRATLSAESNAAAMGMRGRAHVTDRFSIDRLVGDIDELYRSLISVAGSRGPPAGSPAVRSRRGTPERTG